MYFCQKIVEKILYNVKILAKFTFSSFHPNKKWLKQGRFSFLTIFGTEIEFLGKNTSEMIHFKNFEIIFFGHFLT